MQSHDCRRNEIAEGLREKLPRR